MNSFLGALRHFEGEAETTDEAMRAAVDTVVEACIASGYAIDLHELKKVTEGLRRRRRFVAIRLLAEGLEEVGLEDAFLLKLHAQALIEEGSYLAALGLLEEARAVARKAGDAVTEADTWGLQGRIFKDLYVRTSTRSGAPVKPEIRKSLIQRSAAAYHWVFARAPDSSKTHYFGVNTMAMVLRARRDGLSVALPASPEAIAQDILDNLNARLPQEQSDVFPAGSPPLEPWDYANAAEASAALDRWTDVIVWINRYLRLMHDNAFALNGTLRQFLEVWQVKEEDPVRGPVVTALRMALIAAQDGGITLTRSEAKSFDALSAQARDVFRSASLNEPKLEDRKFALENERVLGGVGPTSAERLDEIMNLARSVGRVNVPNEGGVQTIGTGFLLPGDRVDRSLAGCTLFITNAHVVSPHPERDGTLYRPGDAFAIFDRAADLGRIELDDLLWSSDQSEHDLSVFRVQCANPAVATPMKIARGLPNLKRWIERGSKRGAPADRIQVPGKVYVIGHPLGGKLSISMEDNDLIGHENMIGRAPGPEVRRIHYRAPTEKGNSGSPVFNSLTLELIGVHHRGGELPRLNGQDGYYSANEGIWIRPALNAMRLSLGLEGDVFGEISG